MNRKAKKAERIADALDVPLDVLCDVARIEIIGTGRINIENFRGILEYNESCVKINTTEKIVRIDGDELFIESITDEGVTVKGKIIKVEFV